LDYIFQAAVKLLVVQYSLSKKIEFKASGTQINEFMSTYVLEISFQEGQNYNTGEGESPERTRSGIRKEATGQ